MVVGDLGSNMKRHSSGLPEEHICVGCGYCCITAQCVPSVMVYNIKERCPDLIWNGSRYICRLIDKIPDMNKVLAIGEGCCSPLFNTWRTNVTER